MSADTHANEPQSEPVRENDRTAIIDLSYRYAAGVDHRDWSMYRSVFTDVCTFDFSSWSARPAATMPADEWVEAVRSVNGNFDATQHIMTNHRLTATGPGAVVGVNEVQAQHWFGAATMVGFGREAADAWCLLGGHYTNRYVRTPSGWKIASCQLTVRWRTGDESIFAFARRAA